MNRVLPTLLMVFALGLCGLCVFQWVREGQLQKEAVALNDDLYKKREAIQSLEFTVKQRGTEIVRLEGIRTDLSITIVTNKAKIDELAKYAEKLEKDIDNQKQTIEKYKETVGTANDRLQKQNEDIVKQNDIIKEVAKQRDETLQKYAKLVEDYNKLVKDFNKAQEDIQKMADAINAANAANAAPGSKDQKGAPEPPKKK